MISALFVAALGASTTMLQPDVGPASVSDAHPSNPKPMGTKEVPVGKDKPDVTTEGVKALTCTTGGKTDFGKQQCDSACIEYGTNCCNRGDGTFCQASETCCGSTC